ncbi:MAG: succinylglutamate desuccinylase/aspartoacylase family protein [Gammaproteobacteria bacterium]|nr:succinylglutamate desuccinylase/aspartoacylase family protein [Gammaproteobacteria bacterium]
MLWQVIAALLLASMAGFVAAAAREPNAPIELLGKRIEPGSSAKRPLPLGESYAGDALTTPVLVAHGAHVGPTLCLTAALHGDELNGIEVVRRVLHEVDVATLSGTLIGVPVVNLLAFTRGARETPDRRDLNRYFPGRPDGSFADRVANALWTQVVTPHCDYLVDFHTGSFNRANLPQLRANLDDKRVRRFVSLFGDLPVMFKRGSRRMLRRVATEAGIPSVSFEFGEATTVQTPYVERAGQALHQVLVNLDMQGGDKRRTTPRVYRKAFWIRSEHGGIFVSHKQNGDDVKAGEVIGVIANPLTEEEKPITSSTSARILGLASNQFVLPGYGVFHLGVEERNGSP